MRLHVQRRGLAGAVMLATPSLSLSLRLCVRVGSHAFEMRERVVTPLLAHSLHGMSRLRSHAAHEACSPMRVHRCVHPEGLWSAA